MTDVNVLGTVETVIDGHTYEMQKMPATRAWKMMLSLTKMLGPSLGKLLDMIISSAKGGEPLTGRKILQMLMNFDVSSAFASDMIEALVGRLEEDQIASIINELSHLCSADKVLMGSQAQFDAHFTGRPFAIIKWLVWALKAQYSGTSGASMNAAQRVAPTESGQPAAVAQ